MHASWLLALDFIQLGPNLQQNFMIFDIQVFFVFVFVFVFFCVSSSSFIYGIFNVYVYQFVLNNHTYYSKWK